MIFDTIYNKGYEAGVNATKLEKEQDHTRRLEDMLKRGKDIGYTKGYHDGYTIGYNDGKGTIDIPDEVLASVKEEFEAIEDDMREV